MKESKRIKTKRQKRVKQKRQRQKNKEKERLFTRTPYSKNLLHSQQSIKTFVQSLFVHNDFSFISLLKLTFLFTLCVCSQCRRTIETQQIQKFKFASLSKQIVNKHKYILLHNESMKMLICSIHSCKYSHLFHHNKKAILRF